VIPPPPPFTPPPPPLSKKKLRDQRRDAWDLVALGVILILLAIGLIIRGNMLLVFFASAISGPFLVFFNIKKLIRLSRP